MNFLSHSPQLQRIMEALGMTIFHSFWQGLLLMLLLWALLKWISYEKPQIRFLLSFATLILLLISFVTTFYYQWDSLKPLAPLAQQFSTKPITLPNVTGSEVELTLWDQMQGKAYEILFQLSKSAHWMAIFWLMGSFFFSARLGLGLWQVRKLKQYRQTFPEFWQQKALSLQQQLGIRQRVIFGCSHRIDSPLTLGWLKPIILLPASMLMAMPADQLESILVHELAHIRRYDYLWNLLQSLSEVVLFYHPAYWYIASVLQQERELACDAITLQVTGKPQVYAQALLQVASLQTSSRVALSVRGRSGFAERIKRIVTPDNKKKTVQPLPFLLSFCLLGILLFAFTLKSQVVDIVEKGALEQKSELKEADTIFYIPYLQTYDGYGQMNDMSNLPATGEYLQKEIDYAPSFQEVMDQVPDIVLDTSSLTIGEIYDQYVSLDQSLNTLQKSFDEIKGIATEKVKINFSAPNVLYLLDGIATDPKKIMRNDVSNIAIYASHMIDGVDTARYKLVVKAQSRKATLANNKIPGSGIGANAMHEADSILFIIDEQVREDIQSFEELDSLFEKEDFKSFSISVSKEMPVHLVLQEKQYQKVVNISTSKKEAKNIARGKIVDQQTGKPLSGVEVTSLTEEKIKTYTDEDGAYELRITEETEYLQHALPGYMPFILPSKVAATFDTPAIMPLKKFDEGKENDFESNLRVFPNPGSDEIKVGFHLQEAASVEFEMLDKEGRFLNSFEYHFFSAGAQEITIPTDSFPADTYLLRVNLNGKYEILRFILK